MMHRAAVTASTAIVSVAIEERPENRGISPTSRTTTIPAVSAITGESPA